MTGWLAVWLTVWWAWLGLALLLGIIEIVLPSYMFLGFSIGAIAVAALLGFAPDLLAETSLSAILALFAGFSLIAWLVLRIAFRKQSSGSKIFTKDIND